MAIYSEQKFVHVPVHLPLFLLFFLAQNDLSLGRYMLMMMMSIITEAISNNPVSVASTAMPATKLPVATCTANPKHYNTTLAIHTCIYVHNQLQGSYVLPSICTLFSLSYKLRSPHTNIFLSFLSSLLKIMVHALNIGYNACTYKVAIRYVDQVWLKLLKLHV